MIGGAGDGRAPPAAESARASLTTPVASPRGALYNDPTRARVGRRSGWPPWLLVSRGRRPMRSFSRLVVGAWLVGLSVAGTVARGGDEYPTAPPRPVFVRGGLWLPPGHPPVEVRHQARPVATREVDCGDAGRLLRFDWTPGQAYEVVSPRAAAAGSDRSSAGTGSPNHRGEPATSDAARVAPWRPPPRLVRRWPLEDASAAALGGTWPDAVVKFSPGGHLLAVGSFGGWLRVFDVMGGELVWANRVAEGFIKRIAWSPDGRTLYAGEQSPDGRLWAFARPGPDEAGQGWSVRWSARTADQIETSRPPAGDRYGIYTLPAIYDMQVAPDGRVLVAAAHSWTDSSGTLQNRAQVSCFDPSGKVLWRFPAAEPARLTITSLASDGLGRRVLVLPHRSAADDPSVAEGSTAAGPRAGALVLLEGLTGERLADEPLVPWGPVFPRIESWDSLALSPDGRRAAVGLSDGRGLIFDVGEDRFRLTAELALGTPLPSSGVPVVAAASYTRAAGDLWLFQTQNAHVPFTHAQASSLPLDVHPGARTIAAFTPEGQPRWRFRGPWAVSGQWCEAPAGGGTPRWLLTMARDEPSGVEPPSYGALLFDLSGEHSGRERLVYHYPTVGPPLFHADISADGLWWALVESPTPTPDGRDVSGAYQVHVVH